MKIGLFGYGKMGQTIDRLSTAHGIEICWRINRSNMGAVDDAFLRLADVVIEFSRPEAAFDNVMACLHAGVPVVCGTTGWQDKLEKARAYCQEKDGALLWASNFSIGVNLFFALNRYLAELMKNRPEYSLNATEIHHIHKLDAPSGTAISLLEQIIDVHPRYESWSLEPETPSFDAIPITALREGEVPGTHMLNWQSPVDQIRIEHRAESREGFALGAIQAAKWIHGKKGVFGMAEVLGI